MPKRYNSQDTTRAERTSTNPGKGQYQTALVDQHSREEDATTQVLAHDGDPTLNEGNYSLATRKSSRHKSQKETPAKSEGNYINSADPNKQNYYKVLAFADDEESESNKEIKTPDQKEILKEYSDSLTQSVPVDQARATVDQEEQGTQRHNRRGASNNHYCPSHKRGKTTVNGDSIKVAPVKDDTTEKTAGTIEGITDSSKQKEKELQRGESAAPEKGHESGSLQEFVEPTQVLVTSVHRQLNRRLQKNCEVPNKRVQEDHDTNRSDIFYTGRYRAFSESKELELRPYDCNTEIVTGKGPPEIRQACDTIEIPNKKTKEGNHRYSNTLNSVTPNRDCFPKQNNTTVHCDSGRATLVQDETPKKEKVVNNTFESSTKTKKATHHGVSEEPTISLESTRVLETSKLRPYRNYNEPRVKEYNDKKKLELPDTSTHQSCSDSNLESAYGWKTNVTGTTTGGKRQAIAIIQIETLNKNIEVARNLPNSQTGKSRTETSKIRLNTGDAITTNRQCAHSASNSTWNKDTQHRKRQADIRLQSTETEASPTFISSKTGSERVSEQQNSYSQSSSSPDLIASSTWVNCTNQTRSATTPTNTLKGNQQTVVNSINRGAKQPIETLPTKLLPTWTHKLGTLRGLRNLNLDRTKTTLALTALKPRTSTTNWIKRKQDTSQTGPEQSSKNIQHFRKPRLAPSKQCKRRKRSHRKPKTSKKDHTMQLGQVEEDGTMHMPMIAEIEETHVEGMEEGIEHEEKGLTDTVDLTDTAEEVVFTHKPRQKIDPTAYTHDAVIAQKQNHFPKGYINKGRETIIDIEEDDYCYLTPMTVRIQSHKSTTYRAERVLYSILLALQHCDPTARLVIWNYDGDEDFSTLKHARRCSDLTPGNVKDFIEEPRTNSKSYSFSGRICILSEYSLVEMKQDEAVREWLNKERVYLSENGLATATTAAVGIITGWTPRNLAQVHTARIRNEIPTAPDFLVEYKWLSDGSNIKAKFIVMRAAQRDVAKLVKRLIETNSNTDFTFHPWDHIMSLSKLQKRHFIQTELKFQQQNYSLLIKDLRSGIDDLPMRYKETTLRDKTQTVRAFLFEHYKTWDGHCLFQTIHKEAAGVIELLVTEARFIEAKRCVEQLRQDLSCHMSAAARRAAFDDYKLLQNRVDSHILWTAIDLSGYAASVDNKQESTIPKRQRMDTSISTYSNITKNSTVLNSDRTIGGGRYTPASSVTETEHALENKTLLELQSNNKALENKVIELEVIVSGSQASIEKMLTVMNQKNISRDNDIDNKVGELELWVKQSQLTNTKAIRDLTKEVNNNDEILKQLTTQTIPVLQHDLQTTKTTLETKMDDGFNGIRNMFENMMNQYQGNSLHRADGDNHQDVTHKRNRSSSKQRKSQDGGGKPEKIRTESTIRRRSGDSRDNDNLEELTHSDHQMHGTGEQS
jgi:hypothetical protein